MTGYLIDTPTLIDVSKGRGAGQFHMRAAALRGDVLATCDVIIAEFYAGIAEAEWPQWKRLFSQLKFWPITRAIARRAGALRYAFARRGIPLATPDALIAALAIAHNAVLVTENVRDFPMPELRLESCRIALSSPETP